MSKRIRTSQFSPKLFPAAVAAFALGLGVAANAVPVTFDGPLGSLDCGSFKVQFDRASVRSPYGDSIQSGISREAAEAQLNQQLVQVLADFSFLGPQPTDQTLGLGNAGGQGQSNTSTAAGSAANQGGFGEAIASIVVDGLLRPLMLLTANVEFRAVGGNAMAGRADLAVFGKLIRIKLADGTLIAIRQESETEYQGRVVAPDRAPVAAACQLLPGQQ